MTKMKRQKTHKIVIDCNCEDIYDALKLQEQVINEKIKDFEFKMRDIGFAVNKSYELIKKIDLLQSKFEDAHTRLRFIENANRTLQDIQSWFTKEGIIKKIYSDT